MNAETIAKIGKGLVILAGIAGYNIDPDQVNTIIQGGAALYAVLTGIESWLKSKK